MAADQALQAAAGIQALAEPLGRWLRTWLPEQRWFSGKGRALADVMLADAAVLGRGRGRIWLLLVEVRYAEGDAERYFVPLRPRASGDELLAALRGGDPGAELDDALARPGAARALLRTLGRGARLPTARGGWLEFTPGPLSAEIVGGGGPLGAARPLGAEQSNSSVVFGNRVLLKCFRRVEDGPNPDLEVPRFLASRTPFRRLPCPAGYIEYRTPAGTLASLGVAQEFIVSQGDGWALALRALREARGQWLIEAARALGRLTAELHVALASDAGEPAFAPEPVTTEDLEAWRGGVLVRLARAKRALEAALAGLPPAERARARAVLEDRGALAAPAEQLRALAAEQLVKTRFHGDYHLGQVLLADDGWVVLDFEGEPLRPLAERRAKGSPLRDVAGMLRSFDYARRTVEREVGPAAGSELAAWAAGARAALLEAYLERVGSAGFVPSRRADAEDAIAAFELEKAAYELEYELRNRPDWVGIPLAYLADLLRER